MPQGLNRAFLLMFAFLINLSNTLMSHVIHSFQTGWYVTQANGCVMTVLDQVTTSGEIVLIQKRHKQVSRCVPTTVLFRLLSVTLCTQCVEWHVKPLLLDSWWRNCQMHPLTYLYNQPTTLLYYKLVHGRTLGAMR